MSQRELLTRVLQALGKAGIEYVLTGSLVSSLQGEPRSTHDIDLVVAIDKSAGKSLLQSFPPPEFYLEESAMTRAIDEQGMFNLLHVEEGDKVDFWILTDEPFDQSRFSRRYRETVLGISMQVTTPEDTILAKLRWAKLASSSEKQFQDALRVYEVQYQTMDSAYLERWVQQLGIGHLWKRLIREAVIIN